MQTMIPIILDAVVASLLAATILFCWRLNVKIRILQDTKGELAQLIRKFDETTERATKSILDLQGASKRASELIAGKIEKANFIADDLSFMIDRGNKLADKIESGISTARKRLPTTTKDMDEKDATGGAASSSRVHVQPRTARPGTRTGSVANKGHDSILREVADQSKATSSLESVLERMSTRKGRRKGGAETLAREAEQNAPAGKPRSKAEQQLLEALKSGA